MDASAKMNQLILLWDYSTCAGGPLKAWYDQARREQWGSPANVQALYPSASIVGKDRVVFRLKGGAYRLIVKVFYPGWQVYIRFIGTHAEYDRINTEEV